MSSPTPTPKTMEEIKSKLLKPALTSHYQCFFNPPELVRRWSEFKDGAGAGATYEYDLISLSCSEASLPGSSLNTIEINDDYTGVTERHAYRRVYDDRADFTFYVDGDYKIIKFFENWISYIVDEQFATRNRGTRPGIQAPNYYYRVNFPDTYRSEAIYIKKFERDYSGSMLQYRFLNAFPTSISSMPVSYESSSLLKCTVSFTYSRYVINDQLITPIQSPVSQTQQPVANPTPFDTTRMERVLTNEYYNNGIRGTNFNQRQAPGDRRQDVTNFTRDIA